MHNTRRQAIIGGLLLAGGVSTPGWSAASPRALAEQFAARLSAHDIAGFAALFAGFGGLAGGHPNIMSAAFVVIGVAAGSTLWWLVLTTFVGLFHASISDRVMLIINRGSGFAIAGFGAAVLIHLAVKLF